MAGPVSTLITPAKEVDRLSGDGTKARKITITVSSQLVDLIDQLKGEWGMRARGTVVERLIEQLLTEPDGSSDDLDDAASTERSDQDDGSNDETTSLVLISRTDLASVETIPVEQPEIPTETAVSSGIDLPGFVRRRTTEIKETLKSATNPAREPVDLPVSTVSADDLSQAGLAAEAHWRSLYGQDPGETVVEAAMAWLSRDVWPSVDASDGKPFSWTLANRSLQDLCTSWCEQPPSLGSVMVIAGALEDPFATASLAERMPTLIRRFVNRFRRSRKVTSFETLESTMTVHGALKLLGLSTKPGASVTLTSIRDAYKGRALEEHPDAGGSTDAMRRLNEAYKLLRELYRSR